MLVDHQIRSLVQSSGLVEPYKESQLQPASYDMVLSQHYRYYLALEDLPLPEYVFPTIDPKSPHRATESGLIDEEGLTLAPQSFVLCSTEEVVRIPNDLVARVEGKSSLARMGLMVHVTAGFIDPGFQGHITLELFNANHLGIKLYPGMPICQLSFQHTDGPAHTAYSGKYQHAFSPMPQESMYYKNFET